MYPSVALCRAQEAFQRDRAASTPLPNVRKVAQQAEVAWGIEAIAAERRERRQENVRLIAAGGVGPAHPAGDESDRIFSENPDRGYAGNSAPAPAH